MANGAPEATLAEMRALLADLPGPDLEAGTAASLREARLAKPAGALGRLEEIAHWVATWQGRHPPSANHPRTAVFAGTHGVAAHGVSAYPATATAQMVQNVVTGGAAVDQLCRSVDADLRVYEMSLDEPTADFTTGPAMSDEECALAIAYGMMAVEPGIDLLAVGEIGVAGTTSGAALAAALWGGAAADWVGPGAGVSGAGLANKIAVVERAVSLHRAAADEPFELLRRLGGRELAGIVGAVLAARRARVPVLLDGFVATAAASVLAKADAHALDHCLAAHGSGEPGHRLLLQRIGKVPLFEFGLRLGEASGATLAIALVKAAVACHVGMATVAEAGISGKPGG